MKPKSFVLKMLLLLVALAWVPSVMGADIPRITKEELRALIDNPNVIIVDVRTNAGWSESKLKIKGAVREDPTKVKSWIEKYPLDKTFVFYCSWVDEETSVRVAQEFIKNGYAKVYALKGGWTEWEKAKFPTETK